MYLIDTNVLSEARRGSPQAITWLRSIDAAAVHVSVLSLSEIMRGIALKARSDQPTANVLTAWLDGLRRDHASRILPITDLIALEWGRLAAQRPRGMADGLIAATALVHNHTLVTRNVTDFADIGLALIDPWNA